MPLSTIARWLDGIQPAFALAIRLYIARVFLFSALTKLRDWDVTQALFENEYHVPLLSPAAAALFGTSAELLLPLLVAVGLATRPAALALCAFNAIAVVSYPDLSDAGFKDHVLWAALILVMFFYGPGRWSADEWIVRRFRARA